MAEFKQMWANKFKKARQKTGMTRQEFAEEKLGMLNHKPYVAIEKAKAAPSKHLKHTLEKLTK